MTTPRVFLLQLAVLIAAARAADLDEQLVPFEGDIIISQAEEEMLENGVANAGIVGDHFRWSNGRVPYEIDPSFSHEERQIIMQGMREISSKTCVKFVPKWDQKDYISIIGSRPGCWSLVGRQGRGAQLLNIQRRGCVSPGTVAHELIHAIGFWHEQSRTDRDDYITVLFQNIQPGQTHNFNKYTSKMVNDYGVPYDLNSIMHYPDNAFARRPGLKTIIPKRPGAAIGNRNSLSQNDILKINRMYCQNRRGNRRSRN